MLGLVGIARVWAAWSAVQLGQVQLYTPHPGSGPHNLEHFRLSQAVVDMAALAGGADQPGCAQNHQLLRDVSLTLTESLLEVAYTCLALAEQQQHLQARRVAKQGEELGQVRFG